MDVRAMQTLHETTVSINPINKCINFEEKKTIEMTRN